MDSTRQPAQPDEIAFGPFRLSVAARRLERDGVLVKLGGRALDLLICLARQQGSPVTNKELMRCAWQDVVVEDGSLRVNIASLRRALGDDGQGSRYILNIPGRGYSLVASAGDIAEDPAAAGPGYRLPSLPQFMVGREELVPRMAQQLIAQRFLTIVGPGGIGKTTAAVAIGHALRAEFEGAVCFVDLGALAQPDLLANTVLATLGLSTTGNAAHFLLAWMQDKKLLLILDNCEHIIDAVAVLAEQLYQAAPALCILATSREALRVHGEHTHRILPLAYPPEDIAPTAQQALAYPAVRLFADRAKASDAAFELSDLEAPPVAQMCRQLDGIALAIELLASRVASFGVSGTADLLKSGVLLSCPGQRDALPRHQTLMATLDWSCELLAPYEKVVFRRLSIFAGRFSLEAALHVSSDEQADRSATMAAMESLVGKSLVSVEMSPHRVDYRLLESTREYALQKLRDSGDVPLVARRNAEQMAAFLELNTNDGTVFPTVKPLLRELGYLGNLRACVDWCFSADGDPLLGARLCAAAMRTLLRSALLDEASQWSERAIAAINASAGGTGHEREELVLQEALAIAAMYMGASSRTVLGAIERGIELAQWLGAGYQEMRLLSGLNLFRTRIGDLDGCFDAAVRAGDVARRLNDPAASALAECMLGGSHHLLGHLEAALVHCREGLALMQTAGCTHTICFGYDHRLRARTDIARILWLKGEHARGLQMALQIIAETRQLGHAPSYCMALIHAGQVLVWSEEWELAEALVAELSVYANKHMLGPYQALAQGLKGQLLVRRGQAREGVPLLRACFAALQAVNYQVLNPLIMSAMAEGLIALGELDEAKAALDQAAAALGGTFHVHEIVRIQKLLACR